MTPRGVTLDALVLGVCRSHLTPYSGDPVTRPRYTAEAAPILNTAAGWGAACAAVSARPPRTSPLGARSCAALTPTCHLAPNSGDPATRPRYTAEAAPILNTAGVGRRSRGRLRTTPAAASTRGPLACRAHPTCHLAPNSGDPATRPRYTAEAAPILNTAAGWGAACAAVSAPPPRTSPLGARPCAALTPPANSRRIQEIRPLGRDIRPRSCPS
jgi:hypothetical protein